MNEPLRPAESAVLAVYIVGLAGAPMADVEWLYFLSVLTALAMGRFPSVRRPENAVRE